MHARCPSVAARSGLVTVVVLLCLALGAAPALAKPRKGKAKPAKPAANVVTLVGTADVVYAKKGKITSLAFDSEDGRHFPVTVDRQGKKLAKAAPGARLEVVAKVVTKGKKDKKQSWLQVRTFRVLPKAASLELHDEHDEMPPADDEHDEYDEELD